VDEADASALRFRLEQVCLDGALDDLQERLLTHAPNIRPEVERHLLPDHGRYRQRCSHLLAQATHPPVDYLPQEGRHDHPVEFAENPAVRAAVEHTLLHQGAQELGGEKGVAFGVLLEIGGQAGLRGRIEPPSRANQCAQGIQFQPAQIEPQPLRFPDQRRELLVKRMAPGQLVHPIGHDQQERQVVDAAGDVPEEFETRRVSPVEVFEHDEDRSDRGKGGDEVPHLGKECGLTGDAFEPPIGEGSGWWRQVCPRAVASDKVEPGTVGRSIRQVVAVAGEDEHVADTRFPNEVAH
jgi:hypothetical protein